MEELLGLVVELVMESAEEVFQSEMQVEHRRFLRLHHMKEMGLELEVEQVGHMCLLLRHLREMGLELALVMELVMA